MDEIQTEKKGSGDWGHFLHSSLVSRISTATVAGKSDPCRTAQQFSAIWLPITRHVLFSVSPGPADDHTL